MGRKKKKKLGFACIPKDKLREMCRKGYAEAVKRGTRHIANDDDRAKSRAARKRNDELRRQGKLPPIVRRGAPPEERALYKFRTYGTQATRRLMLSILAEFNTRLNKNRLKELLEEIYDV